MSHGPQRIEAGVDDLRGARAVARFLDLKST
jgi:hypothetical protein